MQFSHIALAILAVLIHGQAASAAPCAPYETAGAITQPTGAPGMRPAPMPYFKGNNNPDNIEWEDIQTSRGAHAQRRVHWRKSSRRASQAPPALMRSFAERRTARY